MRPLSPPAGRGHHSAPTVPMKPIRFSDLVPDADPAPAPAPPKAPEPAPRSPAPTVKTGPRAAAGTGTTTGSKAALPPKRPAEEPPADVPRKPGLSTSVMLKASHLHKLAAQAEQERKFALTRKGSSRSTRAPFPSVRPAATPPAPAVPAPQDSGSRPALGSNPNIRLGAETTGPQRVHRPDVNLLYDGSAPAEGLSLTNPEVSVRAPVQSYPGQRTVIHTQNVINQYAVAFNPRYAPRAREPREAGHLFAFDVMSSQHTTLERAFAVGFSGTFRPATPVELWKWLSETALTRGWREVEGPALLEAAARGLPVIALAKTAVGPRFAVVEPGPPGAGGKPLLASGHEPRGQRQTAEQIFGSSAVRYLAHD